MLLGASYARPTRAQEVSRPGPYHNFLNTFTCFPGNPAGKPESGPIPPNGTTATRLSEYGAALTPRGDLRVLVIYAGFTNDNVDPNIDPQGAAGIPNNNDNDPNNPWPQTLNGSAWGESLPRSAANNFYTSPAQFSATAPDQTLSNFYYQMSQFNGRPFRMTALNFPVRVNVTATTAQNAGWAWGPYTQQVMDKIRTEPALQAHMAGLSRAQLDGRTNNPAYTFDNSTSAPDSRIDYTIIIWRYAGTNPGTGGPFATDNLQNALGSGGAYASIGTHTLMAATGTTPALTTYDGFTQCLGIKGIDHQLFVHEFAHTLYNAPHVNGNNGVCGSKYYVTTGNSMTTGNINAWERWFLGWAPLRCNGVSGDVTDATQLPPAGSYLLRDFITTGDALRIRLPNTFNPATGTYQYLWLENRQQKSIWDQLQWTLNGAGQAFPTIPTGLMAYVEDLRQNKDNPLGWAGFDLGANGLKYLSAAGHYDLSWNGTSSTYSNALWGNPIYNFQQGAANPTGGQSTFMFLRGDKDANGSIGYTTGTNGATSNEYFHFSALNNAPNYGFLGHDARFNFVSGAPANKIGLASNPALASNPDFSVSQQQLAPMQLSGVSVRLLEQLGDGSLRVAVSFTDTDVDRSTRWTGNLAVQHVPGAAGGYAVNVKPGVRLRINRSGTPNRTTPGPRADFINDTYLTVGPEAYVHLEDGGAMEIGSGSTVFITNSGRLLAEPGSAILVRSGGVLSIKTQAEATALQQFGQLEVEPGGQLIIRSPVGGPPVEQRSAPALTVFPNPTQGRELRFALSGVPAAEAATYTYRLLTAHGRAVRTGPGTQPALSLTGLPAGPYLLELTGPRGRYLTRQVQINP
ncbi:hypothetical protein GCM10022408_32960 [Hymenobacter fastidiosus]|uniref:T9SS type A sorting domain-containing protein n=1 Tax=Hymenobacter fastidiosus TaxID=486264 RepID=A0ABP7SV42_9BACT